MWTTRLVSANPPPPVRLVSAPTPPPPRASLACQFPPPPCTSLAPKSPPPPVHLVSAKLPPPPRASLNEARGLGQTMVLVSAQILCHEEQRGAISTSSFACSGWVVHNL